MPTSSFQSLSRRRLLALAAAASTALFAARWSFDASAVAAADIPITLAPDASEQFRAVVNTVAQAIPKLGIPGAALGIVNDGTVEHALFGVRDVLSGQPVTADTLFQAGSVTKTYTATVIMRLIERGMIALDAPVRTYLPDLTLADEQAAARVTTKNLLTHTGDWWGDSITDTGDDHDAIARFVAEKLPTFPQLAPLGSWFSYNNTGFVLMGRMLEALTGQPYRDAMQSLVLDPIGLSASTFTPDDVIARPHALAHRVGKTGTNLVPSLFLPRNLDPAGNLFTTLDDFLAYARFHLGDGTANGTRVLTPETLATMRAPAGPKVSLASSVQIGLPWFLQPLRGVTLVDHPGDTFGQHAEIVFVPERGFAMAIMTNANTGAVLAQAALLDALKQYLGIQVSGMTDGVSMTAMTGMAGAASGAPAVMLPPDKLRDYVGEYRTPTRVLTIRPRGNDMLVLDATSGEATDQVPYVTTADIATASDLPIAFAKEDLATVGDANTGRLVIEFLHRPDGTVGYLRLAERLYPRQ